MDKGRFFLVLLIYVDEILLIGTSEAEIQRVRHFLDKKFSIKDLSYVKYYLGLELTRSSTGLYVNQRKYTLDLLTNAGLLESNPSSTPLPKGIKLCSNEGKLLSDPQAYRRMIGRLLYLSFTRPDIAYATQQLSQFIQEPRETHWQAAIHVLKYLKGSPSLGLFFLAKNGMNLTAFVTQIGALAWRQGGV